MYSYDLRVEQNMSDVRRNHELGLDIQDFVVELKERQKAAIAEGPAAVDAMRRRVQALKWTLDNWGT